MDYDISKYNIKHGKSADGKITTLSVTAKPYQKANLFEMMCISRDIQKELGEDVSASDYFIEKMFGTKTEESNEVTSLKGDVAAAKSDFSRKSSSLRIDLNLYQKIKKMPEIIPLIAGIKSALLSVETDFYTDLASIERLEISTGNIEDKFEELSKRIKEKTEVCMAKLDILAIMEKTTFSLNLALMSMEPKPKNLGKAISVLTGIIDTVKGDNGTKNTGKTGENEEELSPMEKFAKKIMGEEPSLEKMLEENEKIIEKNKEKIKELKAEEKNENSREIQALENENIVLELLNSCLDGVIKTLSP